MDAATFAAAEAAQRELAITGEHRVSLPDLLIAACAQRHGAAVLHHDRHFELLAERFGFHSIRV
jgi:predicted nucleic acid-binding protein